MLPLVSQGSIDGKQLLDCSPFLHNGILGFRLTFLADVEREILREAVLQGLSQAKAFLSANLPPFSTAKECGQYDFHSSATACDLIDEAVHRGCHVEDLERIVGYADMQLLYVADLRLIKPRPLHDLAYRTLDPLVSHSLSQHLETALRKAGYVVVLGTFGCMTGMYLLVGGRSDVLSEAYMRHIHTEITVEFLHLTSASSTSPEVASAARSATEYIRTNAPGVYAAALEKA
jgi:S-ribosylhomocysteine lyase LuxS involved in autoinducer biosynthesis